jgi:hypothetical protein
MGTAIESIDKHGLRANGNNIPGVHGLLTAKVKATVKRRTLSLAAAVALPALMTSAVLALAGPAPAAQARAADQGVLGSDRTGTGHVSIAITSMNPQYAGPGATVTVAGTISNGTSQTEAGLDVQLYTSPTRFSSRDGMDSFLTQGGEADLEAAGSQFLLPTSVKPGSTAHWSASFDVSGVGMSEFGVYPVVAQLQDDIAGTVLTSAQTLLPFWPGQRAAGLLSSLNISWLWPLVEQPHQQVCPALTNNGLAAALQPGGRLSALVTAAVTHPDADLTWFIDPALLSDVATMTKPYSVGGTPDCTHVPPNEPASKAAVSWLAKVKAATASQPTVIAPFANVDMTALVHEGLTADLASAYHIGDAVARSILGQPLTPTIAWPPGGTADLSLLTSLGTAENIRTVVLNSSELPPSATAVYQPDDAVTSITTGAGTSMNVLLADDTLTGVLAAGDTSSGALSGSAEFAVKQRFLAETAMIAAEAPDSARSVVVAPPENWSPSQALAGDLLAETAGAPWLKPTTLSSLPTAHDTDRTVHRQPLQASQGSPGELSRGYLGMVKSVGSQLSVYESMLFHPEPSYLQSLDEALAATESAAWRGRGAAQGQALAGGLQEYLHGAEDKVRIITSTEVSMAGASGPIPVVIQNSLLRQAIEVRVNATVVSTPRRTSQLTIGRSADKLVVVQPGEAVPVRLPVSSAPQGPTVIRLGLTSANGTTLPFAQTQLTVESTRYGRAILFLIGAAIGVLVLTSVYRGARRRLRGDGHVVYEEADPPGSVVTGTSAQHPTEAPDDLADARRWADDA